MCMYMCMHCLTAGAHFLHISIYLFIYMYICMCIHVHIYKDTQGSFCGRSTSHKCGKMTGRWENSEINVVLLI